MDIGPGFPTGHELLVGPRLVRGLPEREERGAMAGKPYPPPRTTADTFSRLMQNMIQGLSGGTTCSTRELPLPGGTACGDDKRSTLRATSACLPR